ncbi:uncharacterized protein LOC119459652 [Dermacentor silvarum]|uniref:uncharacterized protein LOC119459652 n=1 Tax=Dermacentor silvarum TaxID=543639 RepID=UPI001899D208|nr:uncharacterized protein LOC119459652 [Dermacentor silvarum]
MAEKQLVAVLLWVGLAGILTSENLDIDELFIDTPDIRKFVATKEPLWTYNVTGRSHVQCKVDVMINKTDTSIFFTRLFYYGPRKQKLSLVLEGQFNVIYPEHMLIRRKGSKFYQLEQIIYMSPNSSCAVIMITLMHFPRPKSPPIRWYELRVRNSSIIQGPDQGCEEEFDDLLYRQERIYQPYCQKIVPNYTLKDTK